METFDVAVVGGGLIGCSIAFELAAEKLKVVVLEKQEPGREASWAAAGMLSPAPESDHDYLLTPLSRESLRIYPEFVNALEHESGKQVGYKRDGALELFFGVDAEARRAQSLAIHKQLLLTAEGISIQGAEKLGLSRNSTAQGVAYLPDEGTVEPRLLLDAVLVAVQNRGAQIRTHCEVTSLLYERDRCIGVVANGRIIAKHVVIAAGCYSGRFSDNRVPLSPFIPAHPVRGQMLALRHPGFTLKRVLRSKSGYLVPRSDGRIVAGSTIEEAGFEKKVTAAGIHGIVETATELCPELKDAELLETWCGLRPGSPDALPILGPIAEGLIAATGHYRNGILLAPITSKLVREWILKERTSFDAEPYSPNRFRPSVAATAQLRY